MEDIIKNFIDSNPGVMLLEMEKTLNQSRLRLGYIVVKLINEGKIVKIENKYYPIKIN